MLIDWFTVGAQALNFLILVWLMKRFLYRPVLNAIDAREKGIAATLAAAETKKAEAKKERDDFQLRNETFDRQRDALLTEATDAANAERQRLVNAARQAAEEMKAKQQEAMSREAQSLNQAVARRIQDEVFGIARQALADLAGTSLEEQMAGVLTRRLHALDADAKARFGVAIKNGSEPVLVRSAFDLPAALRTSIGSALNTTFEADIPLRFTVAPDLVSGIELSTNGLKVSWSIAEYLSSLEEGLNELVNAEGQPAVKSGAAAT